MKCKPNCGACCIAPSISSALPNMPNGKKAGELCANLDPITFHCGIWGTDTYPLVCGDFKPSTESCGDNRDQALSALTYFEKATCP
ncbi:YkgJ family cysteine cluster protein [Leucothrix sargassi]|nr:YkgJ family cysteine cluster protein [Leucothrix sargassi]